MKAFGNFRINTKSNFQSEGQAEQDDEGQILSLIFQCGFSEMVLLFFFLLVCEILSPVCPPKIFFKKLHIDIQHFMQQKYHLRGANKHSASERGLIFAQAYPRKAYIDLCIADRGITLKGSFNNAGIEIADDVEAMQAANKRISSKNLPNAENRGYGIYTSKKMLISGLGGHYMMISGSALYLKDSNMEEIMKLPEGIKWNGTVIALRLPYQREEFSYTNYFE